MTPYLISGVQLGKNPKTDYGGTNYWVGNAIPNPSLNGSNYYVFCGHNSQGGNPTGPIAEECCRGIAPVSTKCGKYTPNSSACSQLMTDYLVAKISSGNPTDTITAIQQGNQYLSQVTNLTVRDYFVLRMWRAFWESRYKPGDANDYQTFTNLSDADRKHLDTLIAWCGSTTHGMACSAYVTQAGTGICNGPSVSSPLTRADIDPYSTQTTPPADQRAQLRAMCGCNLAPSNYPNPELGIKCDPFCASPSTIQNAAVGQCTSPVCVIDDFTINLAKSSSVSGGVNINQICTGGKKCNSACYIDFQQIDANRGKISGGININQDCGGCFDAITLKQVDCGTGVACTGPNCGGCSGGSTGEPNSPPDTITTIYYWLKARPSFVVGIFIIGVLLVALAIWIIMKLVIRDDRSGETDRDDRSGETDRDDRSGETDYSED